MKETNKYKRSRERMVREQLQKRGISEENILEAFKKVPRHLFVPENQKHRAYEDYPLPIGKDQTISQPYIVALMTQLLQPNKEDKVLEIGTGSGYQTAILAELVDKVFTIERIHELMEEAKKVLTSLSYDNIKFQVGDGTLGWKEKAPFDKIIGTGAAPEIPSPLQEQLVDPGILVIPAGSRSAQYLHVLRKEGGNLREEETTPCSFLPLIGKEGW